MENANQLADRYIAAWNETDATARRGLIAQAWAEDATYLDPALSGDGHDGIAAMIEAVQARFPGHRFRRTGEVESHHDRLRFTWTLAPAEGPAVVSGTDFAIVTADGRLAAVTGFFDAAPGA